MSTQAKKKRIPYIEARPRTLKVAWGRWDRYNGPSLVYAHGGYGASSADSRLFMHLLEGKSQIKNLISILDKRGYDSTTLKFSISLKPEEETPVTSPKRLRTKKAKPGELRAYWGNNPDRDDNPQLRYASGGQGVATADAMALKNAFEEWDVNNLSRDYLEQLWLRSGHNPERMLGEREPSATFVQTLIERGYDMATFDFRISQKAVVA